ncbi:hypothetical protein STEG23_002963, partial [Scotinomys teguina]
EIEGDLYCTPGCFLGDDGLEAVKRSKPFPPKSLLVTVFYHSSADPKIPGTHSFCQLMSGITCHVQKIAFLQWLQSIWRCKIGQEAE